MSKILLPFCLVTSLTAVTLSAYGTDAGLADPYELRYVVSEPDTIPLRDRQDDFITDPNVNPFDLKDPSAIDKTVEYDPETNRYIITEKIGEFNFRPPSYLTFDEYMEWRRKQDERAYFNQLSGVSAEGDGFSLDPIDQFDVSESMLDRLFGGTEVNIQPQGSIDLTFGVDFSRVENPILTERQRLQGGFDFDMNIQMNVTGKIGEKLNLSTNYNTNATFNFDNQIKLDYNSDLFSEDDIIKKIEAGNVSLPLRGTLIQGAQSLFGLKTELQFGHLRLTAIASQQNSQRENIQLEGGSQLQEFEVKADEYDENRHFFLSHYNRASFESTLQNMPQLRTLFRIENIEVWITNDRREVDDVRDIIAFADLGEAQQLVNPDAIEQYDPPRFREIYNGKPLPDNDANGLYRKLLNNPGMREIDQTVSILQSSQFGLQQSRDFEKVSARKLSPTEYTYHPELGFISLNINVQPDQVVGVAFQYSYNGETYKVGELSINQETTGTDSSLQVLYVKMLKSTTQRTDIPTWDLMMKNVYSIGAFQVNQEDFRLDIFYEDPGKGEKRFLPETNLAGKPLLRVFNLDQLNVQGDPQPDGVFDFVTGITINPRNGRIMFPVLEPFGSALDEQITTDRLRDKYVYNELYDRTIFLAREFPEKNRYVIRGEYKSSVSSEISLGAFNIPPGSVRVSAGGQILIEGRDYEVDYNIGRVRILNDAILNSGVPINVSFEDNTLFGFQTKTMLGLRADYELDENFNIGGTFLQLFERPFTQKVNVGEDPINNKIYGLDVNLSREAPWLTRAVDALPLISTKAPSNISFMAEAAVLRPGHARAVNQSRRDREGVVYIDDFEGSASSFDLRIPANQWVLASVPQNDEENNNPLFPESRLVNDIRAGANRARMNWYRIDQSARGPGDNENPYTQLIPQNEIFPNLKLTPDQLPNVQTLDITYYPNERGPYNFDVPDGYPGYTRGVTFIGDSLILRDPETRWAGIMRDLNTNDFQAANIEFLEFWMLSPFLDPADPQGPSPFVNEQQGDLYINLGNISEDILRDSRKFFENGLPAPANPERRVDTTSWSVVPVAQQITNAFDNDVESRQLQDVGLDGLSNEGERQQFASFLNVIQAANPVVASKLSRDPANDDYRYYRDDSFGPNDGILQRYRDYNNPQGNSRANTGGNQVSSATNIPDAEDLNDDNTLNETESYFQYKVPLRYDPTNPREIDVERTPFITDRRVTDDGARVWYRFRVPLTGPDKVAVGGIRDFRSIRFIRMYMQGFRRPVTLRFARLELVRNQWRRYTQDLYSGTVSEIPCEADTEFEVDAVNIEENSGREPFNYVLPLGIQREQSLGVFNALQNEQSLTMVIDDLCDGDSRAVFKQLDMDMRVYKRLRMFVHAEELYGQDIPQGGMRLFLRLGSDFKQNYYEYEIPLTMSEVERLTSDPNSDAYKEEVWRPENELDIPLELLKDIKVERNERGASVGDEYIAVLDPGNQEFSPVVKVRGNPNLGRVKVAMVGVRNRLDGDGASYSTEVWVNEMRLSGLDERGGAAAMARLDMQLADFGSLTLAGNISTIGFGALDQKVQERSREQISGYDLATNLELGKLLPETWGVRLPFYGQISNQTRTPEFDPYDLDIRLKEKIDRAETPSVRDSIREQSQEVTTIKSVTFTNVRKERTGANAQQKPKPWDIENFSANYAYTRTDRRDPIIEFDEEERYVGGIDYGFQLQTKYIEPLKSLSQSKLLKLITDFNFNPVPSSFNFSTVLDRRFARTRYRFTGLEDRFNTFFLKRFTWDRDYDLQWDLARSLKLNFTAISSSVIDEPDELAMLEDPNITNIEQFRRDSIWTNIMQLGRPKNYRHSLTLSYTAPTKSIPFLDWIQVRANYQSDYSWTAAALNVDSLGNVIQNSQNRQINADLNFEQLYNKIPYLQKINRASGGGRRQPARRQPARGNNQDQENERQRGADGPSGIEKALIRPLMLLRRARLNYTERFSTILPGFMPQTSLLGMSSGFDAPGWRFVAGLQPDIRGLTEADYGTSRDWLYQNRRWITPSVFLNQEVVQDYTQTIDGRATIEPFADFRIEVEANKTYNETHTEYFKVLDATEPDPLLRTYSHAIPQKLGSMTVSYMALNTFFNGTDVTDIRGMFQDFEANRVIVSQRLGTGFHQDENLAQQGFTDGYGRTQQDVLLPAFIAAYTGQDARTVSLDVFDTQFRPNWRLTYNGLSRIPLFQEIFSNFSLSHSYKSTLTINSFNTGLDYLRTRDMGGINELNFNFYPRLEIPQVAIQEAFGPLISVSATMVNGMSFNVDYKKARTLAMSFVNNQLSETQTEEFVIGFGYQIRGLDIPFLTGSKKKRRNDDQEDQQSQNPRQPGAGGRGGQLQVQDLDINFDLSLRDDVTFNHLLDQNTVEPTRGNYSLSISPSAEYKLNQRLSLRLFFDYRRNRPKTSAGFPRTDTAGGLIVRFQLN